MQKSEQWVLCSFVKLIMNKISAHMWYNTASTDMYITSMMRYGACWAQAIVSSDVRVKTLGEPKFLNMQQSVHNGLYLAHSLHYKSWFSCGLFCLFSVPLTRHDGGGSVLGLPDLIWV
jgi:hypothetical protein